MNCLLDTKTFDKNFFEEIREAEKAVFVTDNKKKNRDISLCGRILLSYILSEEYGIEKISYCYGKNEKPYLENKDIFFNISHSGNLVLCCTDKSEIGCDVQQIKKYNPKVAKRFFAENEAAAIENSSDKDRTFIKFWALKESILKKNGTGISGGLAEFDFSSYLGLSEFKAFNCYFSVFSVDEYEIAVCSESKKQKIEFVSKEKLEKYIENIKFKNT